MPGKSKRKKLRYSSSNQSRTVQTPAATTTTPPTRAGNPIASKPQSVPVKSSPSASRAATAQYTPDQFKYVSTELKVAGTLSAIILVVIVALYFILH
jgi:hypothetical protein